MPNRQLRKMRQQLLKKVVDNAFYYMAPDYRAKRVWAR